MLLHESNQIVMAARPQDATCNLATDGCVNLKNDWISMANYGHACFIISVGRHGHDIRFWIQGGNEAAAIAADNRPEAVTNSKKMFFKKGYQIINNDNTASEAFGIKWSKGTDSTFSTGNNIHTDRAKMYLIELEGAHLGLDKNNQSCDMVQLRWSTTKVTGGQNNYAPVSAIAVLSQPRFAADTMPKAKVETNIVGVFAKR